MMKILGYHDDPDCMCDLWSPNPTRWGDNAIENRAFSSYAKHQCELDSVVKGILNGQTSFTLDDDFGQNDLDYIAQELNKHGVYVDLNLE